jgi:polyisoprenoid-binding protein YceI
MHRLTTRRRRLVGLPLKLTLPIIVLAIVGFQNPVAAQEATATPETTPGVLESDPANLDCDAIAAGTPPPDQPIITPAAIFQVVGEESTARYRVEQELVSIGANEAVGETNAIVGQLLFDESGLPLACSRFDVDIRTLDSGEPQRDNYLFNNTLESEEFPLATFVLTAVEGLDQPLADGVETTFILIGDLAMHGVTRSVAWEGTVQKQGDQIIGSADTTFEMSDFDIEPPSVPVVLSLDETVRLEVDLTAAPAA